MAALMIQGCGSDVGKTVLVAGLCRLFANRGLRVLPFKPQNMSNNAAVTADGGEIGRAQALQAVACRVAPSVDMNPVLLKPQSDVGAQLIVGGKMAGTWKAEGYQAHKATLLPHVLDSYHRLATAADLVLIEGAGSPAEINLRTADIANMGFAQAAGVPVVLVGDIDRGHVIAALVGAQAVLAEDDSALIKGFIINKFRGDPNLFSEGRRQIAERTGWRDFGMVPWLPDVARLPAEDAVVLERSSPRPPSERPTRIVALQLSRLANFDEFDPLQADASLDFSFLAPGNALRGDVDVVIIPGTKATLADLAFLREQGWDIDVQAHVRRGGRVLGICGGYQMLGRHVADLDGVEGLPAVDSGLGLLDVETTLTGSKVLRPVSGSLTADRVAIHGYEMHVGRTAGPDAARPMLHLDGVGDDGARSADGRIAGCYVHGLFTAPAVRRALLGSDGRGADHGTQVDSALDALADALERALDIRGLANLAGLPSGFSL